MSHLTQNFAWEKPHCHAQQRASVAECCCEKQLAEHEEVEGKITFMHRLSQAICTVRLDSALAWTGRGGSAPVGTACVAQSAQTLAGPASPMLLPSHTHSPAPGLFREWHSRGSRAGRALTGSSLKYSDSAAEAMAQARREELLSAPSAADTAPGNCSKPR